MHYTCETVIFPETIIIPSKSIIGASLITSLHNGLYFIFIYSISTQNLLQGLFKDLYNDQENV